jgi:hypothetical protein
VLLGLTWARYHRGAATEVSPAESSLNSLNSKASSHHVATPVDDAAIAAEVSAR